mgnify:FL=1
MRIIVTKTKNKAIKRSFHVPNAEAHVLEIVELIAEVTNQTASSWIHNTIMRRLREIGVLNADNQIVQSKLDPIVAALPPGSKQRRHYAKP